MKNRILGTVLVLAVSAALMAGCGRSGVSAVVEQPPEATPEPTVEAAPAAVEEAPAAEQPVEAAPPENVMTAEDLQAEDLPEGQMYSYLTGEPIDIEVGGKRPFAVMINNLWPAVPQSSISQADILYEANVESEITRFMAVFQDVSSLEKIGPVRSCRHYYLDFADDNQAIYTHFGWSFVAEDRIANEGRTTINGMMYDGSMGFFRSSDRVAPHNAYVTGQGLQDIAASLGLTRDYPAGYTPNLHFNKTDTEPEGGETANSIILPYPVDSPWFEYNAEDKLYYRYEYGDAHTDMENGEQLKFKNVLVQYMEQEGYLDDPILLDLHVVGQGSGLYFTDGKVVPVTWEKKDYGEATQWFGPDGEPLMMNPGKTMIQVIQPELTVTYSEEAAAPSGLEAVPVE